MRIETRDGARWGGGSGEGPAFITQITNNGLFLVFTALAATLPFFLPMAVGVIAGDAIAGEGGRGTLRYHAGGPGRPHPAAAHQVRDGDGLLPAGHAGGHVSALIVAHCSSRSGS
ncbi:hypothetical protein GCM10017687_35160 [Streptomyces echinatus]